MPRGASLYAKQYIGPDGMPGFERAQSFQVKILSWETLWKLSPPWMRMILFGRVRANAVPDKSIHK